MVIGRDFRKERGAAAAGLSSRYGASWARGKAAGAISLALSAGVVALGLTYAGAARAEALDLLAFGDSLTQGYGLIEQEGLVPQLRAWLAAHGAGDVRVINAGVSGDTTAGGKARIDWALTPEVDAMILELGANDFLRGIDPASARANLEAILTSAQKAGVAVLLVGMQVPSNYGADYQQEFNAIYPELAQAYGALYMPSFFEGLQGEAQMMSYFQPDGLHPTGAGVAKIVEALGPRVLTLLAQVKTD